jgi:hypothetical protein
MGSYESDFFKAIWNFSFKPVLLRPEKVSSQKDHKSQCEDFDLTNLTHMTNMTLQEV